MNKDKNEEKEKLYNWYNATIIDSFNKGKQESDDFHKWLSTKGWVFYNTDSDMMFNRFIARESSQPEVYKIYLKQLEENK